jgi:hypothetical protein
MVEAICSSETSVLIRGTRRSIPEEDILHINCCENLRSYIILILSFHLNLDLPSIIFPSGFPTSDLYAFFISPIRATCPIHHNVLDFNILIALDEEYILSPSLCGADSKHYYPPYSALLCDLLVSCQHISKFVLFLFRETGNVEVVLKFRQQILRFREQWRTFMPHLKTKYCYCMCWTVCPR